MAGKKKGDFKPRKIKCPTCKGSGTVTRNYKDKNGKWQSEETICSDCDGTGEIG